MPRRDRIGAYAAGSVVAFSVFAVGSAPRWATLAVAGCAALLPLVYVSSRRHVAQVTILLWVLAVTVIATAVQLVPLPAGLVKVLSPSRVSLVVENASALGVAPPSWMTLSYDHAATALELAKTCGYAAFAYCCVRVAASERNRHQIVRFVAIIACSVAVVALVHEAVDATSLFGLYEPEMGRPLVMAPFLNENHLAGFFVLTVPVVLMLAFSADGIARVGWLAGGLLCIATALLTESRGGALMLLVSIGGVAGLLFFQRRRRQREPRSRRRTELMVSLAVVVVCAAVLVVSLAGRGTAEQWSETSTDELSDPEGKVEGWRASTQLIRQNPLFGVGRGAFEYAFTPVQPRADATYSHVENEYLQVVIDWGIVFAVPLLLLFALFSRELARNWRVGTTQAGALAGLGALALHNFVDFNLELPGVALPAIALAAYVAPARLRPSASGRRNATLGVRLSAIGVALATVVLCHTHWAQPAPKAAHELEQIYGSKDLDADAALQRGITVSMRHPADYVILGVIARALFHQRDVRAVPIVNRALALNPRHAGLHHLAAQMLAASQNQRQAIAEYRAALQHTTNAQPIIADLIRTFPAARDIAAAIPPDVHRSHRFAAELERLGRPDAALTYAEDLEGENPRNTHVLKLIARFALKQKKPDVAIRAARQANSLDADHQSVMLLARALVADKRHTDAVELLKKEIPTARLKSATVELSELLTLLGDTQIALEDYVAAKGTLLTLLAVVSTNRDRARAHRKLALAEDKLGNHARARTEEEKARVLEQDWK